MAANQAFITGSIARSAARRYLIYSWADFEVFRPAGATRWTDEDAIWHGGGDQGGPLLLHAKFHPHWCNDKGVGPKNWNCYSYLTNMWNINAPRGYPLCDFQNVCRICTPFQDASAVTIRLDLLQGLLSYGGFKLRGSGYPQIFSAP